MIAGRRDRLTGKCNLFNRPVLRGVDCDHRRVGVSARREAALHDDRGAGRNVIAELGEAGEVIGMDRLALGVELIDTHGVRQIGSEFLQDRAHPLEDVVGFATERRTPGEALARRSFDLRREPAFEVERLMTVQKNPWTRFDRIGVARGAASEAIDRFDGRNARGGGRRACLRQSGAVLFNGILSCVRADRRGQGRRAHQRHAVAKEIPPAAARMLIQRHSVTPRLRWPMVLGGA